MRTRIFNGVIAPAYIKNCDAMSAGLHELSRLQTLEFPSGTYSHKLAHNYLSRVL
jgi:hypothetical protein